MVHEGVQLFFVVLSFSGVICSITSYCLSSKTGAEPPARGPAGCVWIVHMLAKTFFPVSVSTDVAVFRSMEGGTQCTGDF